MRAQRQEIHLLKTGNVSEDDILAAQSRYRVTSAEYTHFSKEMDFLSRENVLQLTDSEKSVQIIVLMLINLLQNRVKVV